MIYARGLPLPALIAALFLVLQTSSATAGPLEDGVKAYSRADYATAMKLLSPLADAGNIDAQYSVAMMYQKGQGVTEDKVKAHMWYDLAARKGDKDAAADRDSMESGMTPQQVSDSKAAAASWQPKK